VRSKSKKPQHTLAFSGTNPAAVRFCKIRIGEMRSTQIPQQGLILDQHASQLSPRHDLSQRRRARSSALRAALKWQKRTIAAWTLGIALPAAAALQFATPTFVASAEVLLPVAMAADEKTNSVSTPDAFLNGQVKLLTSDRTLRTVIDRLGLWQDTEIAGTAAGFSGAFGRRSIVAEGRDGYRSAQVAQLRDRLSVTALAPAPAIRVSYTSAEPYKAAAVANGLVQAYIESYKAEFQQEDRQAESDLAQRLTTLQERAAAAAQAASSEPAKQDSGQDDKRRQIEAILNVYRSLYETTLAQYSELARGAKPAASEPRIVSAATASPGDGTLRLGIMGLALATGGLIGLALAVRREAAHPVRSLNDISANLGMAALGAVSLVSGRKLFPKRMRATPLLLHDDKDHLRALLLRIRRGANRAGPVLLGVASALRGEGKSTVAFNLAVLAVEDGARVLLIDMDLHNSTLSKTLTEDGQSRLVDAIQGACDLQDAIVTTEHGFDFLGERTLDDGVRPVTVLVSHTMEALLARARTLYDIVICDLPPVLDHADMSAMADSLDFFVFIAEWGRTPAHALERALQCSPLVENRVLGALLNKMPSQC
jgi:Mrp family chromosome partitioning ATPase